MLVTRSIMALNSIAPAATVHKLQKLGVRTCRELMSVSAIMLMQWLDISHSSAVCLLATAAATITPPCVSVRLRCHRTHSCRARRMHHTK